MAAIFSLFGGPPEPMAFFAESPGCFVEQALIFVRAFASLPAGWAYYVSSFLPRPDSADPGIVNNERPISAGSLLYIYTCERDTTWMRSDSSEGGKVGLRVC